MPDDHKQERSGDGDCLAEIPLWKFFFSPVDLTSAFTSLSFSFIALRNEGNKITHLTGSCELKGLSPKGCA